MNSPKTSPKKGIASHQKPYHDKSLLEFQKRFPDEQSCWEYLVAMRWPNGFKCPYCEQSKNCFNSRKRVFECYNCGKQISVISGTIFHRSKVPLLKWFWAIFLMSTNKKGVSMLYLQKQLGMLNYRTVWQMGHKIRRAMAQRDDIYSLKGTVEADEIFIGGKQPMKEFLKEGTNKTPFLISVEEDKNGGPRFVSFEELKTIYEEHVLPALQKKITKGATIKSDGAGAYVKAKKKGYNHKRSVYQKEPEKTVEHLKWVNILTSNLKRFLISTYHGVGSKHRNEYLAEFAYRFNRRYWPYQAFDRLLYACVNATPIPPPEPNA